MHLVPVLNLKLSPLLLSFVNSHLVHLS